MSGEPGKGEGASSFKSGVDWCIRILLLAYLLYWAVNTADSHVRAWQAGAGTRPPIKNP